MPAFVDTGVFFAFLVDEDKRHDEALELVQEIAIGKHGTPLVLDLVVGELFTLLRAREVGRPREEAAELLLFDEDVGVPRLRTIATDTSRLVPIARRFRALHDAGVSYVDVAQLALADELGRTKILTFDERLAGLAA